MGSGDQDTQPQLATYMRLQQTRKNKKKIVLLKDFLVQLLFLFTILNIVMKSWNHILLSLICFIGCHEKAREHSNPIFHFVIESLGFEADTGVRKCSPVAGISVLNLKPSSKIRNLSMHPSWVFLKLSFLV